MALLSLSKAAQVLGVSYAHARRMVIRGHWPHYKVGERIIKVDVDEVRAISRVTRSVADSCPRLLLSFSPLGEIVRAEPIAVTPEGKAVIKDWLIRMGLA